MRALVATGKADPLVTVGTTAPPTPAPDEVVIEVEAFSLNRPDLIYLAMPGSSFRPGIDFTGRILVAAADGSGPAVGTPVVAHAHAGGGAAELAAVPSRLVVPRPDNLTAVHAAALPLAGLVALRLVRAAGPLRGKHVLLTGATGGVGHFVVELAALAGAHVTALAATTEPHERIAKLGARVVHAVSDAQGPFDVVLESVGGDVVAELVPLLAPRSLVLWFGEASAKPITLDFFRFFPGHEGMTLRHFVYSQVDGADDARDLAELLDLVTTGRLHPEVGRVADWSETADVLRELAERRIRGKAVLTLPPRPRGVAQ